MCSVSLLFCSLMMSARLMEAEFEVFTSRIHFFAQIKHGNLHVGIKLEMALNEGKISTMCCNDFKHYNSMKNCGFVRATKWQTILLKLHRMEIMAQ